jgi:hypothetical protein
VCEREREREDDALANTKHSYRAREFAIDDGPIDPITGGASAIMGTATSIMMGVADMPIQTLKLLNIHPDAKAGKKDKGKGAAAAAAADDASSSREPSDSSFRPAPGRIATDASVDTTPPSRSNTDSKTATDPETPGSLSHRSTFMSQAYTETTQRSRSPSTDRLGHRRRGSAMSAAAESRSNTGTTSPGPAAPGPNIAESMESAVDTGKGLARIIGAGFKSPMDFSLNVAKGLHNVPKLYGAEVRQVDKVTDFQSGLRTAAKVSPCLCNS